MGAIYRGDILYSGGGGSDVQIDDTTTALDKVWSSSKTASEISQAGGAVIDDTTTSTTKVWSSKKTSDELATKVDTVSGKGLSTEDYTTAEKTKLSGIESGAQVNVQSDWNQNTTTANDFIKNKPTLGTASSKNVPSSGNASSTEVVLGSDSRLTDARQASDVSAWAKASSKPTYTASEVGAIATSAKGVANGVASLGSDGKVPSSQLPSSTMPTLKRATYPIRVTTTERCPSKSNINVTCVVNSTDGTDASNLVSRFNNNNAFIEYSVPAVTDFDVNLYYSPLITITSTSVTFTLNCENTSSSSLVPSGFYRICYCYFE